jgi:NTE family protein
MGVENEADLASYLLFDGPFCRKLIEMGRADAQARRDELAEFFREVREEPTGTPEEPEDSTERFGRDILPIGS